MVRHGLSRQCDRGSVFVRVQQHDGRSVRHALHRQREMVVVAIPRLGRAWQRLAGGSEDSALAAVQGVEIQQEVARAGRQRDAAADAEFGIKEIDG